jgi:hypothetical protein
MIEKNAPSTLQELMVMVLICCLPLSAFAQGVPKEEYAYRWPADTVVEVDTSALSRAIPHPVIIDKECILGSTEPMFPGCTGIENYEERKNCADKLLFNYFYDRFLYDVQTCDHSGISYSILVLDISKTGIVSNVRSVRQRGCDFVEDAIEALSKMIEEKVIWEPATIDGDPVSSRKVFHPKLHIE